MLSISRCGRILSVLVLLAVAVGPLYGAVVSEAGTKVVRVSLDGWSSDQRMVVRNLAGRMNLAGGGEPTLEVTFHAEASAGLTASEILELVDVRSGRQGSEFQVITALPVGRFTSYAYPLESAGGQERESGIVSTLASWLGSWSNTTTEFDGKRVKVLNTPSSGALTLWADYRLTVPTGRQVTMDSVVGVMAIHDADGDFLLDTGSGDVTADRVRGALTVDTGSGDVAVGGFQGRNLAMDTGSGDIRVAASEAGKLVADTGSGDVMLAAVAGGNCLVDTGSGDVTVDCDLHRCEKIVLDTGSGDVEVVLPPEAPFSLRADTGSGDVSGAPTGARKLMDDDELVGFERGQGGAVIVVDTGSGDVLVRNR